MHVTEPKSPSQLPFSSLPRVFKASSWNGGRIDALVVQLDLSLEDLRYEGWGWGRGGFCQVLKPLQCLIIQNLLHQPLTKLRPFLTFTTLLPPTPRPAPNPHCTYYCALFVFFIYHISFSLSLLFRLFLQVLNKLETKVMNSLQCNTYIHVENFVGLYQIQHALLAVMVI